jgi:hypothetical protein
MDEASSLLENIKLPTGYHNISPNPLLVDGLVNLVPSSVSTVDHVVNLVSSSIEPQTQVVDPIPSSIIPNLHLKSETKVVNLVPLIDPTLPLKSAKVVSLVPSSVSMVDHVVNLVTSLVELVDKVVDLIPSLVDPTLPLESETQAVNPFPLVNPTLPLESETQAVDPFPSIDPILPLENEDQMIDLMSLSIDPTLLIESKPNATHIFLVNTYSTILGGIPPYPVKPPPSNEAILFDWGVITGARLPSHIPFNITVQVCG